MHVSFFRDGPHEPPFVVHSMDQVPGKGDTVMLRTHYEQPLTRYRVEGVEWVPGACAANVDVREVTPFG